MPPGKIPNPLVSMPLPPDPFSLLIAKWQREALHYKDFNPTPYAAHEIERDKDHVDQIKKRPNFKPERFGPAVDLEFMLIEGLKIDDWFGDNVISVRRTTEYDDVLNGTDLAVTFHDETTGENAYLAIDATTSSDKDVLRNKFKKIYQGIQNKALTRVKYFEDADGKKGAMMMPRIVIGMEPKWVSIIKGIMVNDQKVSEVEKRKSKDLSVTMGILIMAENQLLEFAQYALQYHHLTDKEVSIANFEELTKILNDKQKIMDADEKRLLDSLYSVLSNINRANKIKSSSEKLGAGRAEMKMFNLLSNREEIKHNPG